MAAKFKCKRCKKSWPISVGREMIQQYISNCNKPSCILRNKALEYIPVLNPIKVVKEEEEEKEIEVFEEQPVGGLISHREMKKKYGWKK